MRMGVTKDFYICTKFCLTVLDEIKNLSSHHCVWTNGQACVVFTGNIINPKDLKKAPALLLNKQETFCKVDMSHDP